MHNNKNTIQFKKKNKRKQLEKENKEFILHHSKKEFHCRMIHSGAFKDFVHKKK